MAQAVIGRCGKCGAVAIPDATICPECLVERLENGGVPPDALDPYPRPEDERADTQE